MPGAKCEFSYTAMRGVRGDAISELDTASLWDYVAMIRPLKMNELKLSELKPSELKRSAAGATKTSESSALLADNVADRECNALESKYPRGF